MRCKKGAAHIEMIASFTLFFFFVLFLLLVLKPYDTQTLSGSVVAGMHDVFEKKLSTNLTKAFIAVNLSTIDPTHKCFYINLSDGLFAYGLTDSLVFNATDSTSKLSNLSESGNFGKLDIHESFQGPGTEQLGFYNVLISPDFEDFGSEGCVGIKRYKLGSIVEREVISQSHLLAIRDRYFTNYDELKTELGVPANYDYSIVIEGLPSDQSYTMQGVVSDSGDVVANEYLKEVLFTNGSVYNARFILRAW